jgi:predicted nucleic acid-binding protein
MPVPDFLESNVLVYAYDVSDSRKQHIAQDLVRKAIGEKASYRRRVETACWPSRDEFR